MQSKESRAIHAGAKYAQKGGEKILWVIFVHAVHWTITFVKG